MTQAEALKVLKTGGNVFLTGEPGSGKTHTINQYVAYLRSKGVEPAITASTGIAATHIGGMTIHAWSGIGGKSVISEEDFDQISQKERVVKRVVNSKVLIIDEISMLSSDTLHSVDRVCRGLRHKDEPFGGLQVIVVGDFFQLPPVPEKFVSEDMSLFFDEEEARQTRFAFRSPAWKQSQFLVCYLSEQHRQEDPGFLQILGEIRSGEVSSATRTKLGARNVPPPGEKITKLFPHNANVDRLNELELGRLSGETQTYEMTGTGVPFMVEVLKKHCLSPEKLTLKLGAKVMFTKNSVEGKYVNGTIGEVTGFSKTFNRPLVTTRSGRLLEVEPEEWSIKEGEKTLAAITQMPLRLAWAITVHKSQGMSLDAALVDLSSAFEYGQGYVALSRVRTLEGMYLAGFNERALEVHPDVQEIDETFRNLSGAARDAFGKMPQPDLDAMHSNFIKAIGGSDLPPGAKGRKPKVRSQKVSTLDVTKELLLKKLSLADMAKERGVTQGTIVAHLEELVEKKKVTKAELTHLRAGSEKTFEKVYAAFEELGPTPMKPVFDLLKAKVPYDTIRLARLLWSRQ